ncbi:hypothetical protein [Inediibacterium massiliense]|uniref:hypothetical protein n=1 Tax=Inediibacterium massiliense TaxID=1658111 RepID=UPI0006B41B67|nr:hypothetical protein [Inediibacterium massiliense]
MNELIPTQKKESFVPEEELSISSFPFLNNNIFMFMIPFFLFIFLKNRNFSPALNVTHYEKPKLPALNENTLDRVYHLLENLKKASHLHDLKKNMSHSPSSSMKRNLTMFKEVLNILGDSMDENSKTNLENIQNVISMVDKMKDVKNVMKIKKAVQSGGEDLSAQVNNIIEAIGPMLPNDQAKNLDNFKKIAQMMKLMSLFDGNEDKKDEISNENEIPVLTENTQTETLEVLEEKDILPIEDEQ